MTDRQDFFPSSSLCEISKGLSVMDIYELRIGRMNENMLSNLLDAIPTLPNLPIIAMNVEFYQATENGITHIWKLPQMINHDCFVSIKDLHLIVTFHDTEEPAKTIYVLTFRATIELEHITKVSCLFSIPHFWDNIFLFFGFPILESFDIKVERGVSRMTLQRIAVAYCQFGSEEQLLFVIQAIPFLKNLKRLFLLKHENNDADEDISFKDLTKERLRLAKIFVDKKFPGSVFRDQGCSFRT